MHIYFNASEIAGLINKNKYNSQEDVIYDILCRVKKEKNTRYKNLAPSPLMRWTVEDASGLPKKL